VEGVAQTGEMGEVGDTGEKFCHPTVMCLDLSSEALIDKLKQMTSILTISALRAPTAEPIIMELE
jgi:hypothetical protein